MIVKIKKLHTDAVIPRYAHATDAGLDLVAVSRDIDKDGNVVFGTGLAFEIPEGYVGLIFPRSSVSKYNIALTNCVGVIDSGYRGEVTAKFKYTDSRMDGTYKVYSVGDRIAQMIILPYPSVEFVEADILSVSERGVGGYGSTGR